MTSESFSFTSDPSWPWSLSGVGLPALVAVALLLTALTIWTYRGQAKAGGRRVSVMIALRLAALLLAVLALVRPSLASRENLKLPSTLIILLDGSESMTITDESNNYSRWEALRRTMSRCEPVLQQFRDEQNVTVHIYRFAEGLGPYDPQGKADGKRTDFGEALHALFHDKGHGGESQLRSLIVVSDGADNGTRYPPMAEAEKWRTIACPIHTFAVGQTTTTSKQKDIILLNIFPEPAPVPVKGKLTVMGLVDNPGFQGTTARVRLLVDDKEVAVQDEILAKATGNQVKLTTQAPDKPGEIKVTLKIDKQFGEVSEHNNEVTTYVTVAKEGLSVLYVEGKIRAYEPKFLRRALEDPRFRVEYMVRLTDDELTKAEAETLKQPYDVIILGDITPRRLSGGDDTILNGIREQVRRGTGLMMIGGLENFGKSWRGTPIADVLPVDLSDSGQDERYIRMVPTAEGVGLYIMKLSDNPQENRELWNELPKLQEMSKLGERKSTSIVLARADDAKDGAPLLVSGPLGTAQGRTLAFGADTTWRWRNLDLPKSTKGVELHRRFWKQVVLWLAKQEEAAGSVWVKPDVRRLGSGGKLGFAVGARGKNGEELKDVRFEVSVTNPQGTELPRVPVTREGEGNRGTFWKTDLPGEYHMTVRAFVKEDGKERKMDEEAKVRFLVYQDTAELARQAADHKFLADLAAAGGGKAHRLDELPGFLRDLQSQPLPQSRRPKTELWPDWRRSQTSAFLPAFLMAFVALLCLEWFLRRYWGLV